MSVLLTDFAINDGSVTSTAYTSTHDTAGANLIVIAACTYAYVSDSTEIVDSAGNSYSQLTQYSATLSRIRLYYKYNPTTNASHKWRYVSANSCYPAIAVLVADAIDITADPFVAENGYASIVNDTSPHGPGNVTPSSAGDLVVAAIDLATYDPTAVDSGFTLQQHGGNLGANIAYGLASLLAPNTSAVNPAFTFGGTDNIAVAAAVFKVATGGGGRTTKNTHPTMLGMNLAIRRGQWN